MIDKPSAMSENIKSEYESIAKEILFLTRNTLVVNFRFMDVSISKLQLTSVDSIDLISTDGVHIGYNPTDILKLYKKDRNAVARAMFHTILHCVFRHFYVGLSIRRNYWDLAADIAIENALNELDANCIRTQIEVRQVQEIKQLKRRVKHLTAEHLYRYFVDKKVRDDEIQRLGEIFSYDDHDVWYEQDSCDGQQENNAKQENHARQENNAKDLAHQAMNIQKIQADWRDVAEHVQMELQSFGKIQGDKAGGLTQNLLEVNREKYNYTAFLRKFATMGEVMKVNDDEFDYIFYTYGLKMYKKMPLIEPLEYKEAKRIKEFIIAIDTSGSTSGELVQKFVQKTYNILKQEDTFFSKMNLHIIQCDAEIQEDHKVTCEKEFDEYLKGMKIRGLGGTDFRPVFSYINKLIERKEFVNLRGMIYFTDGYGTFPSRAPDYKAAFVYIDDEYNNPTVPAWAIKLVLKPEEI